ncbi:DUF4274 domain-containing protein [Fulvivirga ulvae]|uniref:DUF4274 domain-containing protein n=1 Tax=Fulvivirga ulvae TaxID=2904245 RepID=UPI001F1961CB|nr:DUF4274 domain-containing protein [Fulvivirga ulvae]UII33460.1 DUF4274 domain-containing protein [Fulvivirga ulvae]
MNNFSPETNLWFDNIRKHLKSRIKSFNNLKPEVKSKYRDIRDYFIWTEEKQQMFGYPGPIECDIDRIWAETNRKVKKELGGKSEAANIAARILRDEFSIDITQEVMRHSQPCYVLHDQLNEIDWDIEEERDFSTVVKLIKNKNLDRGSALQIYWELSPEYYTQFAAEGNIKYDYQKKVFRLIRHIEKRLLANDLLTNLIPYKPMPENRRAEVKTVWQIPEELKKPNF